MLVTVMVRKAKHSQLKPWGMEAGLGFQSNWTFGLRKEQELSLLGMEARETTGS